MFIRLTWKVDMSHCCPGGWSHRLGSFSLYMRVLYKLFCFGNFTTITLQPDLHAYAKILHCPGGLPFLAKKKRKSYFSKLIGCNS